MNKGKLAVAGIGELLWDLFPHGKELGGAPANFAYHVSRLGYRAAVVSCLGNDQLGDEAFDLLTARGLVTEYLVRHPERETGTVSVELDGRGIPSFTIRDEVAWDQIPFGEELQRMATGLKAVCFGSLAQRHQNSRHSILDFVLECGGFFDIGPKSRTGGVKNIQHPGAQFRRK